MISRPLDLEARLAPPPRNYDWLFLVNGCLIVLFFALFGSRFVLSPGVAVGVGELPRLEATARVPLATSLVVSVWRDNMILFEGGLYTLEQLRPVLTNVARGHAEPVLLVRMDGQVSAQTFISLFEAAHESGFSQVLVATESAEKGTSLDFSP